MAIPKVMLDKLMKHYKNTEDMIGENGILKELTKALVEFALKGVLYVNPRKLAKEVLAINNRPWKFLGYRNPYEMFSVKNSHFRFELANEKKFGINS